MKILHIIDNLSLGGAQTLVRGIFDCQQENKDIFLFSLREKNIKIEINHSNVFNFCSTKKYSFLPLKKIKEIIRKEKIDVLHCHLFRSYIFAYLLKIFYFPKIKIIIHEHGQIFEKNIFYKIFLLITNKKIDLFIACSHATRKLLIKFLPKLNKKIEVLHNFVDLDYFNIDNKIDTSLDREKLGLDKDDFVFGFAARIIKRKGWKNLLMAFQGVVKYKPNCKLLIAGDGKDKGRLLKFIEKNNLGNNVYFLGYISDMCWFYSLIDCFIIPSHFEPMGITEMEAQSMGVPVIASNVDGLNEIVSNNENGLLFEVGNVSDLLEKIRFVCEDEVLRNKLIKNGLESVSLYSLSGYLEKLKKIYG